MFWRGARWRRNADWRQIKESVFRQLLFLLRLIRQHGYDSNWSLIGLRATLYILYSVPAFPRRDRLIRIARKELGLCIERQVLPDGVQQELSPHYHWVALELIVSCRTMALQAGHADAKVFDGTIAAMALFLESLILPDGGLVSIGDSDMEYGPRIKAFVESLRDSLPFPEAPETALFPYAGIALHRVPEAGHHLVFDAGPFGTAHQHEDALSFWLTAFGEHFLIDPGRYQYDSAPDSMYTFLRSSAAHSTIMIGGYGQNARANRKNWRREVPEGPFLEEEDGLIRFHGRYDQGYGQTISGVVHERVVETVKGGGHWRIRDRLLGEGRFPVEARFQFAPCDWTLDKDIFCARIRKSRMKLGFVCQSAS